MRHQGSYHRPVGKRSSGPLGRGRRTQHGRRQRLTDADGYYTIDQPRAPVTTTCRSADRAPPWAVPAGDRPRRSPTPRSPSTSSWCARTTSMVSGAVFDAELQRHPVHLRRPHRRGDRGLSSSRPRPWVDAVFEFPEVADGTYTLHLEDCAVSRPRIFGSIYLGGGTTRSRTPRPSRSTVRPTISDPTTSSSRVRRPAGSPSTSPTRRPAPRSRPASTGTSPSTPCPTRSPTGPRPERSRSETCSTASTSSTWSPRVRRPTRRDRRPSTRRRPADHRRRARAGDVRIDHDHGDRLGDAVPRSAVPPRRTPTPAAPFGGRR